MKKEIKKKGIGNILHFTRRSNLDGILQHGLANRQFIIDNQLECEFTDQLRLDEHADAICCSIGFPNYKMFYQARKTHPESEWVVIIINKCILWKKDCAFCVSNAASANVRDIPIADRKGVDAFQRLFDEIIGKPSRNTLGIKNTTPTDPQAEVLIFDRIKPKFIQCIATISAKAAQELNAEYPDFDFVHSSRFFSARKDFRHWK